MGLGSCSEIRAGEAQESVPREQRCPAGSHKQELALLKGKRAGGMAVPSPRMAVVLLGLQTMETFPAPQAERWECKETCGTSWELHTHPGAALDTGWALPGTWDTPGCAGTNQRTLAWGLEQPGPGKGRGGRTE